MTISKIKDSMNVNWKDLGIGILALLAGLVTWQYQDLHKKAENRDKVMLNIELNMERVRSSISLIRMEQEKITAINDEKRLVRDSDISSIKEDVRQLKKDVDYIKSKVR